MQQMRNTWILTVLIILVMSTLAHADFVLRVEDLTGGNGVVITDNSGGDINPLVGAITFSGALSSGFVVNVTTGLSKPVIGGVTNQAELDLNSVNVQSTGAASLRVTLEDTNYTNAGSSLLTRVGGTLTGPAGSSFSFQGWGNLQNSAPSLGPDVFPAAALGAIGSIPGGSVTCGPFVFGAGAFSGTCGAAFLATGPYALFSQAFVVFTGAGVVSFDGDLQVVPEPSAMLLLGAGLIGLAAWGRRKMKNRSNKT